MELKNQIVLIILIPILLILLLVIFQVGLIGFWSIPNLQVSLQNYQIKRHLNAMGIGMKTLQQEIEIQYQAYLNSITGLTGYIKYYLIGELQGNSQWQLNNLVVNPLNALNKSQEGNYQIDWYHKKYGNLEEVKNKNISLYEQILRLGHGFDLGKLMLNNSESILNQIQVTHLEDESKNEEIKRISYEYFELVCKNSLKIRYPQYSSDQLKRLDEIKDIDCEEDDMIEFDISLTDQNQLLITQKISKDCYLDILIQQNYLFQFTYINGEQQNINQGFQQLFFAFSGLKQQIISPNQVSGLNISEGLINLYNQSHKSIPYLDSQIQAFNGSLSDFSWDYEENNQLYVLMKGVNLRSKKQLKLEQNPSHYPNLIIQNDNIPNNSKQVFIIILVLNRIKLLSSLSAGTYISNIHLLEIVVFILILMLSTMIFTFVWFITYRFGLSFDQSVSMLTQFMDSIDIQNIEEEQDIQYSQYYNCYETRALFQTINIFMTSIKFSNQKYPNSNQSDAIALMELSKAKDFYQKKIGNMSAVGICANNIGILHMKNYRVFEAVNEMEESIYIAKQEIIEIKEVKRWCKKMVESYSEPNFYQNFKYKLQGLANKFRQIEFGWIQKLQKQKKQDSIKWQKSLSKSQISQNLQKNQSEWQINSKSIMPQINLLSNKNQSTPYLLSQGIVSPQHIEPSRNNKKSETLVNHHIQKELISPSQKYKTQQNDPPQYDKFLNSQRVHMRDSMLREHRKYSSNDLVGQNQPILFSELELIQEKLQDLQKKKTLARAKLQNRQFQLASFMFHISIKYTNVFIPETLLQFQNFEDCYQTRNVWTYSNFAQQINLYVKKALCYIQIGEISKFLVELKKAEDLYEKLILEGAEQSAEEQGYNFVDMFKNVPLEVLYAKIQQLKAIYELLLGNFQNSAYILISIIEKGDYYDPEIRDFSLWILEYLFQTFNIPTTPIKTYRSHINKCIYEIVLMIDYSREMNQDQLNLSHSLCREVFELIQPYDMISLYGFNDLLHEAFPLQPKGIYHKLLHKQIQMLIAAQGGSSKLYKALKFGVKSLFKHPIQAIQTKRQQYKNVQSQNAKEEEKKIEENVDSDDSYDSETEYLRKAYQEDNKGQNATEYQQDNSINDRNIYEGCTRYKFICLFTETFQIPTLKEQAILQQLMLEKQVDLLVFNIANQNANMLDLKQLSRITPRSMFINANTSLETIFGFQRQWNDQKKIYLEFF